MKVNLIYQTAHSGEGRKTEIQVQQKKRKKKLKTHKSEEHVMHHRTLMQNDIKYTMIGRKWVKHMGWKITLHEENANIS